MDTVKITNTSYENIYAKCPVCGYENTFNRIEDLKTTEAIAGQSVHCLNENCRHLFRVIGDTVNSKAEQLLFEAEEQFGSKRFMSTILLSVQAVEVFFYSFLCVELIYKKVNQLSSKELQEGSEKLDKAIKKFTFDHMRSLVIKYHLKYYNSQAELLTNLNKSSEERKLAKVDSFKDLPSQDKCENDQLCFLLYSTKINRKRNNVIHKHAYRPDYSEAEYVLKEAWEIIGKLQAIYHPIYEDINWYRFNTD